MKKLYLIIPAYLIITTGLSILEINDRLKAHYNVAGGMTQAQIATAMMEGE